MRHDLESYGISGNGVSSSITLANKKNQRFNA